MTEGENLEGRELRRDNVVVGAHKVVKFLAYVVVVLFVVIIGLSIQVQINRTNVNRIQTSVEETERLVHNIDAIANDLSDVSPDEEALNTAIRLAVSEVPSIKEILCETFPDTTPCQIP